MGVGKILAKPCYLHILQHGNPRRRVWASQTSLSIEAKLL